MSIHPAAATLSDAIPGFQMVTTEMVELAGEDGLPVVVFFPLTLPDCVPCRLVVSGDRMLIRPHRSLKLPKGYTTGRDALTPARYGLAPCDCGSAFWRTTVTITPFDGWHQNETLTTLGGTLAKHVRSNVNMYCRYDCWDIGIMAIKLKLKRMLGLGGR